MDCELAGESLEERAAGLLPAARAAELDEHISLCPACARQLRWISGLKASVRALPRAALPAELRAALLDAAGPRPGPLDWLRARRATAAGLGFASAFAAAGLALWLRAPEERLPLDEVLTEHGRYEATMPAADRESLYAGLAEAGEAR